MSDAVAGLTADQTLLSHEGDIVAATVPALRERIRDAIASGSRDVAIDLVSVKMLDSTGIGLLISAHNSLRKAGGRFSVRRACPEIVDLLRTLRVNLHFSVRGD